EPLELHVENCLRLNLREAEGRHQPIARFGHRFRGANQLDHLVEVIKGNSQALEDVIPRFRFPQIELDPAPDDFASELNERLDQLEQVHDLRPTTDDCEHDDAEAGLQRCVLVKVVEYHLWHFAAFQFDDDTHALAIGLVAKIGDSFNRFFAYQLGDALDQPGLVDLIGNLSEDDRGPIALLVRLGRRSRAHHDRATAGRVRLDDAPPPDDIAGRRKVWA